MFAIGDVVIHLKTKHAGKVVGYGHEIVDGVYTPTLKVLIAHTSEPNKRCFMEEDVQSAWTTAPQSIKSNLQSC